MNKVVLEEYKFEKEEKIKWWGGGEWVYEPDLLHFIHKEIECLIVRVCVKDGPREGYFFGGHLCGYCAIPENCPKWEYGKYPDFDVHGGITFSDEHDYLNKYAIGFDCAHSHDFVPSTEKMHKNIQHELSSVHKSVRDGLSKIHNVEIPRPKYRNFEYVKKECESLADQLNKYVKDREEHG